VWVAVLIAVAALFLYLMPPDWIGNVRGFIQGSGTQPADAAASAAGPASVVASAEASAHGAEVPEAGTAGSVVETVHSAPDVSFTPESVASAAATGPLQLKASEQSWVEVIDGRSQIVFSRMLQPGEMVALDGALPLRIKVGNAAATQLSYRGVAVDLAASTRDNVARLELK